MATKVSVRASGGIVTRGTKDNLEIALVHRPSYDDWSIPKGKNDRNESSEEAALREVWEETGMYCRLDGPAGTVRYRVRSGLKEVEYFFMRPLRFDGFKPNSEVDEVTWVSLKKAHKSLTYDFDRDLIDTIKKKRAAQTTDLHLVRHADAGSRSDWKKKDQLRPLSKTGRRQAEAIADGIEPIRPSLVMSSPYVRCVETVDPLARRLGVEVVTHAALEEGPSKRKVDDLLDEVAGRTVVLCSHGDVIPFTLDRLVARGVDLRSGFDCKKGSTWTVTHDGSDYTDAVYWQAP